MPKRGGGRPQGVVHKHMKLSESYSADHKVCYAFTCKYCEKVNHLYVWMKYTGTGSPPKSFHVNKRKDMKIVSLIGEQIEQVKKFSK